MNLFFHLSFLTHLRESLGNKAVYSQPFVSFPGCRLCFCLKLFLFSSILDSLRSFMCVCAGIFMPKKSMLLTHDVLLYLFSVFSSGAFTHAYFHSWTWVLWSKRSRSFLLFWFNRSSRLLLFLFVGPGSSEAEHIFSIHKHANTAHMRDCVG